MHNFRQAETAPAAEWELALERESVIRPLAGIKTLSDQDVKAAVLCLGLCRSVVYKLLHRYRQRPQTSSLLPLKRGRASNVHVLSPEREQLLQSCIREICAAPERPSMADLTRELKRQFSERKLPTPNYRTVRQRADAMGIRLQARRGVASKATVESLPRPTARQSWNDLPLDVIQIDHALLDVRVVDRERRLPVGRPWLTLAIDVASRSIAGFSVSLETPSALSDSLVLSLAVLPKAPWLKERGLQSLEWPIAGLPDRIRVAYSRESHSEALLRGCQEYGITLEHSALGASHWGAHIEHLIGTKLGAAQLLPCSMSSKVGEGTTNKYIDPEPLTLVELERWLTIQIASNYHSSEHAALGSTPLTAWFEGLARRTSPIRYPLNAEEFLLDFLPAVPRRIRRDGVYLHKMRYWDSSLSPWAGRLKEPVSVKYDPRDLARVFVRDPNGKHWPVPHVGGLAKAGVAGSF